MTWFLLVVITLLAWWHWLSQRDIIVMLGCYKELSESMIRLLRASRDDEIRAHGRDDVCTELVNCDAEWDRLVTRHANVMHARGLRFGPYDEFLMYHWHRDEVSEVVSFT